MEDAFIAISEGVLLISCAGVLAAVLVTSIVGMIRAARAIAAVKDGAWDDDGDVQHLPWENK